MYAYLLGALCNVFATKARDSNRYYEDMDELNGVLAIKKVDNVELCTSLRTYFRFNHTLQDNAKRVLDHVSPSLRGRLAYEVHSAWMSGLQVFEGCDLPDELFINIAMVLKEMVFAPFEVLIEPHHKADSIFVINSGVVMTKGLALVIRGHTFGDEALFAWRNQLPRGYQATSLVQGRAYIMVAQDVLEILHRKQFVEHVSVPLKRISDGKCKHLLQSFARWAYQAANNADTVEEAIEMLLTEAAVVSPTVLAGCVGLMLRLYFRLNFIPYNHDTLEWRLGQMDDVSPVFAKQIVGQMREMDQAARQWVHERKAKANFLRFSGPSALCQASRTFEELAGISKGSAEEAGDKASRMSVMLNKKIRRSTLNARELETQMTQLDTMRERLTGWGLEHLAESLVEEEGLTWDQLRTMNVEQLKLVKIPMGKALSMKKHGFRP